MAFQAAWGVPRAAPSAQTHQTATWTHSSSRLHHNKGLCWSTRTEVQDWQSRSETRECEWPSGLNSQKPSVPTMLLKMLQKWRTVNPNPVCTELLLLSMKWFGHHPETNDAYALELTWISSVIAFQHQTRLRIVFWKLWETSACGTHRSDSQKVETRALQHYQQLESSHASFQTKAKFCQDHKLSYLFLLVIPLLSRSIS